MNIPILFPIPDEVIDELCDDDAAERNREYSGEDFADEE